MISSFGLRVWFTSICFLFFLLKSVSVNIENLVFNAKYLRLTNLIAVLGKLFLFNIYMLIIRMLLKMKTFILASKIYDLVFCNIFVVLLLIALAYMQIIKSYDIYVKSESFHFLLPYSLYLETWNIKLNLDEAILLLLKKYTTMHGKLKYAGVLSCFNTWYSIRNSICYINETLQF